MATIQDYALEKELVRLESCWQKIKANQYATTRNTTVYTYESPLLESERHTDEDPSYYPPISYVHWDVASSSNPYKIWFFPETNKPISCRYKLTFYDSNGTTVISGMNDRYVFQNSDASLNALKIQDGKYTYGSDNFWLYTMIYQKITGYTTSEWGLIQPIYTEIQPVDKKYYVKITCYSTAPGVLRVSR